MSSTTQLTADQKAFIANDQVLASIIWGFTLGFGVLTGAKALRQTRDILRRTGPAGNTYIWLVWGTLLANLIGSILVWLGIDGEIKPSLAYYFFLLVTWVPQIQFILQIIINRISLLLFDRRKVQILKYSVAFIITLVNISVFCIWIPARLNISQRYVHINEIWDRIEKVIFLIIDGALNLYFIYLVRSRLIARGMEKYKPLYRFNLFIIAVSVSMDIIIIGMMSLPNTFVYAQFHPLSYTVKLNIEMSMADFIVKIVKTSQRQTDYGQDKITHPRSRTFGQNPGVDRSMSRSNYEAEVWTDKSTQPALSGIDETGGIRKVVSMTTNSGPCYNTTEVESRNSSSEDGARI